jgi:6-phosphogluconolactonase
MKITTGARQSVPGLVLVVLFFFAGCGGSDNQNNTAPPQSSAAPAVAFVANQASNNISGFTVNGSTGELVPAGPAVAVAAPFGIAVSADGTLVYVTSQGAPAGIAAFTANPATAALTPVTGSPFASDGLAPFRVTVSPNRFVYVTNQNSNDVSAFSINVQGGLTRVAGSPFSLGPGVFTPAGITLSPNGAFLYVTDQGSNQVSAFSVNQTTGALTQIGSPVLVGTTPMGIVVSPNGAFAYVTNQISNFVSVLSIDQGTGALTQSSVSAAGLRPTGITITPNGSFLYVANEQSNDVSAFTVNSSTGALTPAPGNPFPAGTTPTAVTVSPDGRFLYASGALSRIALVNSGGVTPRAIATPGRP